MDPGSRSNRPAPNTARFAASDGFLRAALHSITHTVPRTGLRERLVPWTLAVVITAGVVIAGTGFALEAYGVMAGALGIVAILAVFGALRHSWRASARYKRPLAASVGRTSISRLRTLPAANPSEHSEVDGSGHPKPQ